MPTQPCILGTARLDNFRLNYVPTVLDQIRRTRVRILLNGVEVRVRVSGLTITDVLNEQPNSCRLTLDGLPAPASGVIPPPPTVGEDLRITLNSNAPRLLFAGTLQTTDRMYESRPGVVSYPCGAIDYTTRLNYRRPFGTWVDISATTIAQTILATYAPQFGVTHIAAGLEPVTIAFDGNEEFIACLGRLASLIGGYCKVDDMDAYLFLEDTSDPPDPIDVNHRPLDEPAITVHVDDSQLRTRVYGKGHGESLMSDVLAGETILPVADSIMFSQSGNSRAIVSVTPDGATSLQITYSGIVYALNGALVGTGAVPSTAMFAIPGVGVGLTSGTYRYAYTDVTAAGESLPSPFAEAVVGVVTDPASAPMVSKPTAGPGPDPGGAHAYAATFVTANGETLPSPVSEPVTTIATLTAPTTLPTLGPAVAGNGPDPGVHTYGMTFVAGAGETAGLTSSNTITSYDLGNPTAPPSVAQGPYQASLTPGGVYKYKYVWTGDGGNESTAASPASAPITAVAIPPSSGYAGSYSIAVTVPPVGDPSMSFIQIYRTQAGGSTFYKLPGTPVVSGRRGTLHDYTSDASLWAGSPPAGPYALRQHLISDLQIGPPGTTARRLYRTAAGGSLLKLVATINDNDTRSYYDTVPDASLGATMPTVNAAPLRTVNVTGIVVGGLGVTSRKLYRTAVGSSQQKLVATIANNTATTYTDTQPDSALGANAPVTNTAGGAVNQVALSGIAIGQTGTTARKIYRTAVNGAQLKLLKTIADNTTTTSTDNAADGTLGANAPVNDTSGFKQPEGQVNAGSTSMIVVRTVNFSAGGGWALLGGGQLIRFTGITANSLTGIPASGPGAIQTTVLYGTSIITAPAILNVTGATMPLKKGAAVNIWVQRDDLAAQAAAAARESTATYTSTGIHEHLIVDGRRGEPSLIELCDADLVLFSRPILTFVYPTHDVKSRSGKMVHINLTGYPIGDYVIQNVTIDQIDVSPGTPPRFIVTASSVAFSLPDVLRRLITAQQAV